MTKHCYFQIPGMKLVLLENIYYFRFDLVVLSFLTLN